MTAENRALPMSKSTGAGFGFNEAAADDRGKPLVSHVRASLEAQASMRPRPMTAENPGTSNRGVVRASASMRPRPMTAENRDLPSDGRRSGSRFNEAAADDRGKPKSLKP